MSGEVTNTGLFMSWRGQPEVTVKGNEQGQPVVSSIEVSAFELVKLPRLWDNPEREPDDDPRDQIEAMLGRLERGVGRLAGQRGAAGVKLTGTTGDTLKIDIAANVSDEVSLLLVVSVGFQGFTGTTDAWVDLG